MSSHPSSRMPLMRSILPVSTALILGVAVAVSAQVSPVRVVTDPTQGRAPVIGSATISNQSRPGLAPKVGDVLRVDTSGYTDPDGDPQSGATIQWKRGATNVGTNSTTYTTVTADANESLTVVVTPTTDPAKTLPASGTPKTSAVVTVAPAGASYGNFEVTSTVIDTWPAANSHCQNQIPVARLPSKDELQQLFVDATSSPAFYPNAGHIRNNEMCTVHGWPLSGQCGGSSNGYWSSTLYGGTGLYYAVDLTNGFADVYGATFTFQVVCVR